MHGQQWNRHACPSHSVVWHVQIPKVQVLVKMVLIEETVSLTIHAVLKVVIEPVFTSMVSIMINSFFV